MKFSTAFAVLASSLVTAANAQTVVDVVSQSADHTTLTALVGLANVGDLLSGLPPNPPTTGEGWTVFAPTDAAFEAVDAATVARLQEPEWNYHLVDVLEYHVVGSPVPSSALTQDQVIVMGNDAPATITSLTPPMINEATIVTPDLEATNGFVHVTDGVLIPPSLTTDAVAAASATESLSTLVQLLTDAELVGAIQGEGPYTIFAPTNDGTLVSFSLFFPVLLLS